MMNLPKLYLTRRLLQYRKNIQHFRAYLDYIIFILYNNVD